MSDSSAVMSEPLTSMDVQLYGLPKSAAVQLRGDSVSEVSKSEAVARSGVEVDEPDEPRAAGSRASPGAKR
jgi:hypothetical protein